MGLYIRDDRVRDMARRLAEAQHITVTEAVRQALEHQLSELKRDRAERERRIRESSRAPRRDAPAPLRR